MEENKKKYQATHPSERRNRSLRADYGIDLQSYNDLFALQDYACPICRTKDPGGERPWALDHDHETGRIRAILCRNCNPMLGFAKDNPETLRNAIEYLEVSKMSLFSWGETFFKAFHKLYTELFGSEEAVARVISVTLGVVAPLVETIVTLTAGEPAAAAIAAVVATVQTDLATVTATVASAGPTPTLETTLSAVIANLTALETGAGIKDSATQQKVSTAVKTIVAELQAIISVL